MGLFYLKSLTAQTDKGNMEISDLYKTTEQIEESAQRIAAQLPEPEIIWLLEKRKKGQHTIERVFSDPAWHGFAAQLVKIAEKALELKRGNKDQS